MDSTLQVCSLTQIILNPDCRTVHGFEALIEREWLQAGHPFATRCKHSAYTTASVRTREQSPIFLVFLDCVFQLYHQFPCSFEFNEQFLVMLSDNAYSSQFGTFLGDSVKERKELNFAKKTVSLWSYVNRPEVLKDYLNPLYEPNNAVIWPSVAPQSMVGILLDSLGISDRLSSDYHAHSNCGRRCICDGSSSRRPPFRCRTKSPNWSKRKSN